MKAVMYSFRKFLLGVLNDYMLIGCILVPVLMGGTFHFGIPVLEQYLCQTFHESPILAPYYLIFDLTIAVMTPMMFAFAGVMTTLEELDNGTARYLMVTPIGKSGYLASRIFLPATLSIVYCVIAVYFFGLSHMTLLMNIVISIFCSMTGIIVALFVIAFAGNKVEGMALIKLSGIMILGIPAVFFLPSPIVYFAGVFPSYWFTRMALNKKYLLIIPCLLITVCWFLPIYRKFNKKLV